MVLRRSIALGQKTESDGSKYGRGFNYIVEVSFELRPGAPVEQWRSAVDDVLPLIDHKALGVDVALDREPTTASIGKWLKGEVEARTGEKIEVELRRGDGLVVKLRPAPSPAGAGDRHTNS
jgi:hypothetical protein